MSFESLYEKYQNGTATQEEIAYVEEEIAKARKLSEIMESYQAPQIEEATVEEVQKAKKKFNLKTALRTLLIVAVVTIVAVGVVLSGVFGTAASAANDQQLVSRGEAEQLALRTVIDNQELGAIGQLEVVEIERELEIENGKLNHAYYKYQIDIRTQNGLEIEVEVDSRTGKAWISDIGRY